MLLPAAPRQAGREDPSLLLVILASTEIPEANVTKAKLKCFVIVSFIFSFLLY